MSERWAPVVGYEDAYEVSDRGSVRSLPRQIVRRNGVRMTVPGKKLSRPLTEHGEPRVSLWRDGKCKSTTVARLVAQAFLGPKPEGMEVCHNNTQADDNRVENLRWDTHQENIRDIRLNGKGPAARTHCPQGHKYDEANTYIKPNGNRDCRKCINQRGKESRARRRAIA